jgi:hypothetical protein
MVPVSWWIAKSDTFMADAGMDGNQGSDKDGG